MSSNLFTRTPYTAQSRVGFGSTEPLSLRLRLLALEDEDTIALMQMQIAKPKKELKRETKKAKSKKRELTIEDILKFTGNDPLHPSIVYAVCDGEYIVATDAYAIIKCNNPNLLKKYKNKAVFIPTCKQDVYKYGKIGIIDYDSETRNIGKLNAQLFYPKWKDVIPPKKGLAIPIMWDDLLPIFNLYFELCDKSVLDSDEFKIHDWTNDLGGMVTTKHNNHYIYIGNASFRIHFIYNILRALKGVYVKNNILNISSNRGGFIQGDCFDIYLMATTAECSDCGLKIDEYGEMFLNKAFCDKTLYIKEKYQTDEMIIKYSSDVDSPRSGTDDEMSEFVGRKAYREKLTKLINLIRAYNAKIQQFKN